MKPTDADLARRALDVAVAATLVLVTLPVMLMSALASAAALRSSPFFVQRRVGLDGEEFKFIKVRTLPPSTPRYIDKHNLDQRGIPAVCRVLRRLHLDELPQLLLVLTGRMTLVGPRPEMRSLHDRMPTPFAAERTAVRPGCTGLWQVSEACTSLISAAPEYDRYYIEHRSLRLDLWILWRTARKMSHLGGCVALADVPAWAARPAEVTSTGRQPVPEASGAMAGASGSLVR